MNSIPNTLLKTTIVATVTFWAILSVDTSFLSATAMIISIIPISIISSSVVMITVYPFTTFNPKETTRENVFKYQFPYYTLLAFFVCSFLIVIFDFNVFACAFFTSAYFTLMFAWVWLLKPNKKV